MVPRASRGFAALLSIASLTLGIGLSAQGVAAAQAPSQAGCAEVQLFAVPGTWETNPQANPDQSVGMLAGVTDRLAQEKPANVLKITYVPYSASAFDKGLTYADSKKTGVANLTKMMQDALSACPSTTFILTGYSQGADIVGDVAADIGSNSGSVPSNKIVAVGLLADPGRGTQGESLVGPSIGKQGIASSRPEGFGALKNRVATICQPDDLYCAVDGQKDSILSGLGAVLSKSGSDGLVTSDGPVGGTGLEGAPSGTSSGGASTAQNGLSDTSSLVSDFSNANLSTLSSNISSLASQLNPKPTKTPSGTGTGTGTTTKPEVDPSAVAQSANSVLDTLKPVADIVQSVQKDPTLQSSLTNASPDTAQYQTGQVLDVLKGMDLQGAINTATTIADTASGVANGGGVSAGNLDSLVSSVSSLTKQVAPLTGISPGNLSNVTSIMSMLKPSSVISQVTNVATNATQFAANLPKITESLNKLPAAIASPDLNTPGKIDGVHQIAGDLNNLFNPLVKMAAGVDFKMVAALLATIPDPSGYCQIAAMVVGMLGNLDIIRLANDIGQIQEIAWKVIKGDIVALAGLLPIGMDLATVATGLLTGTASKTDPSTLGKITSVSQTSNDLVSKAGNQDLSGLASTLTSLATSQGADDLVSLATQGADAVNFFASGAHQSYASYVVDNYGRTALQWLSDWFGARIKQVAAV